VRPLTIGPTGCRDVRFGGGGNSDSMVGGGEGSDGGDTKEVVEHGGPCRRCEMTVVARLRLGFRVSGGGDKELRWHLYL
jgi:hypothetical protein